MSTHLKEIRLQVDTNSSLVRTETFNGRDYLVFPIVALKEGVLQGANAASPEYCPADALEQQPAKWNGRPLVMNHPQIQGVFVSANSPSVLEGWAFGYVFNSYYDDGSLKVEGWLDIAEAEAKGGEFQDAVDRINAGEVVEVSTGLFCDVIPEQGTFRGQRYSARWANINSDHLAILSKGVLGACSVEAGCGAPRLNVQCEVKEVTMAKTNTNINTTPTEPQTPPVAVVVNGAECSCGGGDNGTNGATGTIINTNTNTAQDLASLRVESLRVEKVLQSFQIQKVANTLLSSDVNSILSLALKAKFMGMSSDPDGDGDNDFHYIYLVDATSDTAVFMAYDSDWDGATYQVSYNMNATGDVKFTGDPEPVILLTSILPTPKVQENGNSTGVQSTEATTVITNKGVTMTTHNTDPAQSSAPAVQTTDITVAPVQGNQGTQGFQTMESYLSTLPEVMRKMVESGLRMQAARKAELIDKIKANKSNKFTNEVLEGFEIETLEGIVALADATVVGNSSAPMVNTTQAQAQYLGRPVPVAPQVFSNHNDGDASVLHNGQGALAGQGDMRANGGSEVTKFGAPPVGRALTAGGTSFKVGTWKH